MSKKKFEAHNSRASNAITDGIADLESLNEEISEWRDNLDNNNMSHLPKYDEVSEAADTLDNAIESMDVEALLEFLKEDDLGVECNYSLITSKKLSRADRCANACAMIKAGMEALQEHYESKMSENQLAELREILQEFEDAINELEGIYFPGMY